MTSAARSNDLPERNLSKGARGAIVFVFSVPRLAYEVEFVVEDCSTVTEFAVEPGAIRRLSTNRAKHQRTGTANR